MWHSRSFAAAAQDAARHRLAAFLRFRWSRRAPPGPCSRRRFGFCAKRRRAVPSWRAGRYPRMRKCRDFAGQSGFVFALSLIANVASEVLRRSGSGRRSTSSRGVFALFVARSSGSSSPGDQPSRHVSHGRGNPDIGGSRSLREGPGSSDAIVPRAAALPDAPPASPLRMHPPLRCVRSARVRTADGIRAPRYFRSAAAPPSAHTNPRPSRHRFPPHHPAV